MKLYRSRIALLVRTVLLIAPATYAQVLTTNLVSSNDAAVWYRTDDPAYGSAVTGADVDMDVYNHVPLAAFAYMQFDLSELGSNIVVISASLEVTKVSTNPVQAFAGVHSDSDAVIVDSRTAFYGLNNVVGNTAQHWSEASLSFNTAGDEITTGSALGSDPFNTASGRTTDLNGLESISGGTVVTVAGSELDAFVQSRITDGGLATFMLDFESAETGKGFAFNTRNSGLSNAMPTLTLNYTIGEPPPQSVLLVDNGGTAALINGQISAVIDKSNGNITELRKDGGPNLVGNGGRVYFDANGTVSGGGSGYFAFAPMEWTVVTNTPEKVEVALTQSGFMGCDVELHYILRQGESGIDAFTVWEHGAGDPEVELSQTRMVVRPDPGLVAMAYAGPETTGQMIEPSLLASAEEIMDATYKLPMVSSYTNETGLTHDGYPVYSKYDWSQFMEDHHVHGVAGDTYGIWAVQGSVEYCNGGPTKAYQTVHGGSDTPVILWLMQSTHKGASPINVATNEAWTKLFGPYTIDVNEGTNAASLWDDAQVRAAAETSAWPPVWMDHDDFPLERGTVSGRLHVAGHSTSNALMVLSAPGGYWHTVEAKGYQFWTRAEADGSFSIPKVRAGSYSLYAHVPGVVGIMEQTNVVVTANTTNDLGTLEWEPARYERRLFRLGTPDLSTAEFRFGSEMRQYGLWWRYQQERGTNDLDFTIGVSDPATNWYYALMMLPVEITPTNGIWVTPYWNIHFNVDEIPPPPARLSVELAGAMTGAFYVYVNGNNICPNPVTGIYTVNDASIYRSATKHSSLMSFEVTFDPALLSVGTNTITFRLRGTGSSADPWSGTKPVLPATGIMFDCIQLEAGSIITNPMPQFKSIELSGDALMLEGGGGYPESMFQLLKKNSLTESSWMPAGSGVFDGVGGFSTSNVTTLPSGFYRLVIP